MKLGAKPQMTMDENLKTGTGKGAEDLVGQKASAVDTALTQNTFSLTEAEKSSIEKDINAKTPIGDTPAYRKFLQVIFPDKEPVLPYLADYNDALMVVSGLSMLFGKSVRLPNDGEATASLKNNNYPIGFRNTDSDRVKLFSGYNCAWISGEMRGENAPYVGHHRFGNPYMVMYNRGDGRSVIPVFG